MPYPREKPKHLLKLAARQWMETKFTYQRMFLPRTIKASQAYRHVLSAVVKNTLPVLVTWQRYPCQYTSYIHTHSQPATTSMPSPLWSAPIVVRDNELALFTTFSVLCTTPSLPLTSIRLFMTPNWGPAGPPQWVRGCKEGGIVQQWAAPRPGPGESSYEQIALNVWLWNKYGWSGGKMYVLKVCLVWLLLTSPLSRLCRKTLWNTEERISLSKCWMLLVPI